MTFWRQHGGLSLTTLIFADLQNRQNTLYEFSIKYNVKLNNYYVNKNFIVTFF